MSLPKIVTPEYTTKLWSIKTPVRFRPYLVKEEKLLLTAKQAGDVDSIERAVIQVLTNCTFGAIEIEKLPSFDLEYLFLQIRAKSVSETTKLQYDCQNLVRAEAARTSADDDGRCHAKVTITVDLSKVALHVPDGARPTITLKDGLKIELQYPSIKQLITSDRTPVAAIAASIKTIADQSGALYEARDYSTDELIEFVESMSVDDVAQFEQFFTSMPTLKHEVEFVCTTCGYREPLTFEGLSAFFT